MTPQTIANQEMNLESGLNFLGRWLPEKAEKNWLWAGIWTGADTFERFADGAMRRFDFDRPMFMPSYPFQVSKK